MRARRRGPFTGHAGGLGLMLLLALWLMRRFLFTSAFPAGTDMLGFISRAKENSSWGDIFSLWSPSSFGAPRQFTLDNLLGLLTKLTGDPLVTVKLVALATLTASGIFAYLLAWRWYRNTRVATLAGLLYMTSQASISRWASGQLNIEIATAAAPLLIYLWAECIERFSVRRALTFALAASAVMFVRLDMVLYVAPFLVLFVVMAAVTTRSSGAGRNLAATLRVTVPAMVALNLYQIVPALAGVRASWVSSSRLFDINDLVDRSLGAYPSLLGFGREIGYLGFTGQQTWFSHPWLSFWMYLAAASVIVALAYASVSRLRDSRTLFLIGSALLATLLAKGVRDPLGAPYLWAVDHLPVFGNLRGPNRWLIVQGLAYAALSALMLDYVLSRLTSGRAALRDSQRSLPALAAAALVAILLVPVGPTLLSGFRAWRPDSGQIALTKRVAADPDTFRVATVPYDQTIRFVDQGSYHGFEHDLGAESSLWTGHPAIGDGGWNQRAADFVAFTSTLLRNVDPAYEKLLGTTGVKYLAKFNYAPTSPHLVNPSNPLFQQHAISRMSGLKRLMTTDRGDLYSLSSRSPMVSFRPNLALILGGNSGLAALADMPGVDLKNWAAVTADDVLDRAGLGTLLKLAGQADLILVANEQLEDLSVLAAGAVARVPAITSGSEPDRRAQLLPSDGSIRRGSLADKSMPPPKANRSSSATSVTIRGVQKRLELWARVKVGPTAGRLRFSVDGKQVRELIPVAVEPGGFRWVNLAAVTLSPGKHSLGVKGSRSPFGESYEVDETRLIDPVDRGAALARLESALKSAPGKVAYSLDLDDAQKWSPSADYFSPGDLLTNDPASFWRIPEPGSVTSTPAATSLSLGLNKRRNLYTFTEHHFFKAQTWADRPYLSLRYRGSGSGTTYLFIVDFDSARTNSAVYSFVDSSGGWQTRTFSLQTPLRTTGTTTWSHIKSVRIAANSKAGGGNLLELGAMSLSKAVTDLPLRYPMAPAPRARTAILTASRARGAIRSFARIPPSSTQMDAVIPIRLLGKGRRVLVPASAPLKQRPASPVQFRQESPTKYDFSFESKYPGMLVLSQGFHPKWKLTSGGHASSVPVFGVANGFLLGPGRHSGSIGFTGQTFGWWGIVLSLLSLVAILFARSSRKDEEAAEPAYLPRADAVSLNGHKRLDVRPKPLILTAVVSGIIAGVSPGAAVAFLVVATLVLRPAWWMPWAWGLGLLTVTPVAVALGVDVSLDDVGFLFVVFMTIGFVLLVRDVRRTPVVRTERRCRGVTHSGEPCRRAPVHGGDYCPAHAALRLPAPEADPAPADPVGIA